MKLLGVLGGMSWVSTADLYRRINEGVARQLGGLHSARLLLHSVDFAPVAAWQAQQDWAAAGAHLAQAARSLRDGGAQALLLATNTMHQCADAIEEGSGLPLLHIVDLTAAALRERGVRQVGLLGTGFTMSLPFYGERLARHGMHLRVPAEAGRAAVHAAIYDELCHGRVTPATRSLLQKEAARLLDAGCQAVVLGCTELGLALPESDAVLDSTRIQAEAAVAWLCATPPQSPSSLPSSTRP